MATTIANLRIQLSASTKGLQTPLKNAKKDISGFSKSVNSSSAGLGRLALQLGAAAVGFLAVRRVITSVSTSLQKLDEIGKVSDRIGITAEALQKLRFAGELTGVSISTMDTALLKFRKTTAEAATTSKSLDTALIKVVGNTKGFINLPFETQMKRFADGLERIENQAERVRLANLFLGRSGQELLTTLQGGSDQLDDMFRQAERAGLFTTADIRQAEAANDAMLRISKTLEFITGQFAIQLAPAIEKMATALQTMGLDGKVAGQAVARIGNDAAKTATQLGLVGLKAQLAFAEITQNATLIETTTDKINELQKSLDDLGKPKPPDADKGPPGLGDIPGAAGIASLLQPAFKARGSVAAFSAIQGEARRSRVDEMVEEQKKGNDEAKKMNEKLGRIEQKITPLAPAIV